MGKLFLTGVSRTLIYTYVNNNQFNFASFSLRWTGFPQRSEVFTVNFEHVHAYRANSCILYHWFSKCWLIYCVYLFVASCFIFEFYTIWKHVSGLTEPYYICVTNNILWLMRTCSKSKRKTSKEHLWLFCVDLVYVLLTLKGYFFNWVKCKFFQSQQWKRQNNMWILFMV